ncbi:PHP domain-containing protein, partial [Micromonospora fluostatini]
LHVHTEYSMLDGAARHKDLFAEVTRLGMSSVAMTDHGNMHGAPDFIAEAAAAGVKPILGVEAYRTPGTHRRDKQKVKWSTVKGLNAGGGGAYTHMTILAESAEGLRNLMRMSTRASLEGQITAGFGRTAAR